MKENKSVFSCLLSKDEEHNPVGVEIITSPLDGTAADITAVADKVFADKVLGDGMAVIPTDGKVYAPVDGTVENLPETKHALCIVSAGGAELLIHVGRDTVALNGMHFTIHVKKGQRIKRGDLLLEFELKTLLARGFDLATPVVVSNCDRFTIEKRSAGAISHGEELLRLSKPKHTPLASI